MDNKELTEEEKDAVKKTVNLLARFVTDKLECKKERTSDLNSFDKKAIRILAEDLHGAFVWGNTKEGHNYWSDVYNKLRRIAEEGF